MLFANEGVLVSMPQNGTVDLASWWTTLPASDKISLLFAGIVAISTVVYAWLTWGLLRENKRLRQAQSRPHVTLYVEPSQRHINILQLVIRNDGGSPAKAITFEVEQDWVKNGKPVLAEKAFLNRPWAYLGIGQTRRTDVLNLVGMFKEGNETKARIKVTYSAPDGQEFTEMMELDLMELQDFMGGAPAIEDIKGSLAKMAKTLDNIGSRRQQIHVLSESLETYLERQQQNYDEH
jgi:hypothetical protein